eukprot:1756178-Amphidinium_carterae.1
METRRWLSSSSDRAHTLFISINQGLVPETHAEEDEVESEDMKMRARLRTSLRPCKRQRQHKRRNKLQHNYSQHQPNFQPLCAAWRLDSFTGVVQRKTDAT